MKRLTKWMLALALLPLLWAVLHQTGLMIPALAAEGFSTWWRYGAGALCYLLIERFLAKPMWLYVFGHELTHAVSGVLTGASIHSFKAKATGGEVRLSKSNAFIALSPYIIPLYALVLIGAYALARHWWNPPALRPVFQFLLGFAVSFHISLTVSALHKHQSDLKVLGFFLSGVLIALGNIFMLAALGISLFSKTPTFSQYGKATMQDTAQAWKISFHFSNLAAQRLYAAVRSQPWTQSHTA